MEVYIYIMLCMRNAILSMKPNVETIKKKPNRVTTHKKI